MSHLRLSHLWVGQSTGDIAFSWVSMSLATCQSLSQRRIDKDYMERLIRQCNHLSRDLSGLCQNVSI